MITNKPMFIKLLNKSVLANVEPVSIEGIKIYEINEDYEITLSLIEGKEDYLIAK